MADHSYSSHRLDGINDPPRIVSWSRIIGGISLIAIVLVGLFYVAGLVEQGLRSSQFRFLLQKPELFNTVLESGDLKNLLEFLNYAGFLLASVIAGFYCAIFALTTVLRGVGLCLRGVREIIKPFKPASIGKGFYSTDALFKLLRDGEIELLYPTPAKLFTVALFGQRAQFTTPTSRTVVDKNVDSLKSRLYRVVFLLLLAAVLLWGWDLFAASGLFVQLSASLQQQWIDFENVSNWGLLYIPIVGFVLHHGFMAAIEYCSTAYFVPESEPSTQTLSRSQTYNGFGNAQQLMNRIPDMADALAWRDFPNRVSNSGFSETESPSFKQGGKFSTTLFIEQQPQPISDRNTTASAVLLIGGWILQIIAAVLLFTVLLPFPVLKYIEQLSITERFLFAPIYVFLMAILITRVSRSGVALTREAQHLFQSLRFRSESVLMDIEGTLSRSKIKVGKAADDSVESSSEVERSDFTVRFWAGQVLSEARQLDAVRVPLSVAPSELSRQWLDVLANGIESLRETGIAPIGVDITAPELRSIVDVNAHANAYKQNARQISLMGQPDAQLKNESDQLGFPKLLADNTDDEYKICPACAESIKAKALLCRYCRTEQAPPAIGDTD